MSTNGVHLPRLKIELANYRFIDIDASTNEFGMSVFNLSISAIALSILITHLFLLNVFDGAP